MEKTRIVLYKNREFGEVFNATFDFIKQEFIPLGRAILVFILPLILIQGIFTAFFQSSMMGLFKNPDIMSQGIFNFFSTFLNTYLLYLIVIIVVQTMTFSTIVSYMKLYNKSENEITIATRK